MSIVKLEERSAATEYERLKKEYVDALERMNARAHDFTAEGDHAFMLANRECALAYSALWYADQRSI